MFDGNKNKIIEGNLIVGPTTKELEDIWLQGEHNGQIVVEAIVPLGNNNIYMLMQEEEYIFNKSEYFKGDYREQYTLISSQRKGIYILVFGRDSSVRRSTL